MYWLFQANPKYSRILDGIRELKGMYWVVTRYADQIAVGDRVLIGVAGKEAGIYALAEVMQSTHFVEQPPDLNYWLLPMRAMGRFYTSVRFTRKLLNCPLLKARLRYDPILSDLQVLRAPHSTNFKVSECEWQQVCQWLHSDKDDDR